MSPRLFASFNTICSPFRSQLHNIPATCRHYRSFSTIGLSFANVASRTRIVPHPPRVNLKHHGNATKYGPQLRFASYGFRPFGQQPPPKKFGTYWDKIPHDYIIYTILGLNSVVFIMWWNANTDWRMGDPRARQWMLDNFAMSWRNLTSSRPWVLVTSGFSHDDIPHLAFNCFTFYFTAGSILGLLGTRSFLGLYLAGGVFASLFSASMNKIMRDRDNSSIGASGSIYATLAFLACAAPRATFYLYAVVPVPAWLLVSGVFAFETWSTSANRQTKADTLGHIGGILAGVGYFVMRRFGLLRF